jgi:hypothetical protein
MPALPHPITNKAYVEFIGMEIAHILALHMLPSRTMDPEGLIIQSNQDVHVWLIWWIKQGVERKRDECLILQCSIDENSSLKL